MPKQPCAALPAHTCCLGWLQSRASQGVMPSVRAGASLSSPNAVLPWRAVPRKRSFAWSKGPQHRNREIFGKRLHRAPFPLKRSPLLTRVVCHLSSQERSNRQKHPERKSMNHLWFCLLGADTAVYRRAVKMVDSTNLVDPASCHMLVSRTKPCKCQSTRVLRREVCVRLIKRFIVYPTKKSLVLFRWDNDLEMNR